MSFPTPPENILTSRIPGGCEVSTIRYNTGRYETAILNDGKVIGPDNGIDFNLADALRTHANYIDMLCGGDLDAKRNTVKRARTGEPDSIEI